MKNYCLKIMLTAVMKVQCNAKGVTVVEIVDSHLKPAGFVIKFKTPRVLMNLTKHKM